MKKKKIIFFLLLAIPTADASTVYFVEKGLGVDIAVQLGSGDSIGTFAGQLWMSWKEDKSDPYTVYCIGVSDWLLLSGQEVDIRWLSELPDRGSLNPPHAQGSGSALGWLLNTYAPYVNSNESAAALGLALWEILYDAGIGFSLFSGNFRLAIENPFPYTGMIAAAHSYLATIKGNQGEAIWLDAYGYDAAGKRIQVGQDLAAAFAGYKGPMPIPEASPFLLVGFGILALGWAKRRRMRSGLKAA